jgi:hypothetical protein
MFGSLNSAVRIREVKVMSENSPNEKLSANNTRQNCAAFRLSFVNSKNG